MGGIMNKKNDLRKQLEAGVAVFLSEGKQITKLPTYGKKKQPKPKEETVEIEVDYLPKALQTKYFGE
jgi:hypothetical protein